MRIALALVATLALGCSPRVDAQPPPDPLPSWRDGAAKRAIVDFVRVVTTPNGPRFVPPADRVAAFDHDGTLWPEQPLGQLAFTQARLRARVAREPSLRKRESVRALLAGDEAKLATLGRQAVAQEILALVYTGVSDEELEAEVRRFVREAHHPTLGARYGELAYRPMRELLDYLRREGFTVVICTGGGIDFLRAFSDEIYGVDRAQVIGSRVKKRYIERNGAGALVRTAELETVNDKQEKPVNLDLHLGRRPILAAGNVRSGGDIAMLTWSASRDGPSLQLLVDHDDAEREFAYGEPDNASKRAAATRGFQVVSMKRDWSRIFVNPK